MRAPGEMDSRTREERRRARQRVRVASSEGEGVRGMEVREGRSVSDDKGEKRV